jgi:polysaccharide pyruvyl transferase CsaB
MRVLVAGWIGSTNLGDELVFAGLRAKLAARGAEVVAVSEDPAGTARAHRVAAVAGRNPAAVLAAAGRADALVLGGGGLLQDETSVLNLPYHLARVWAARARRTPFAAVGVGAGRLDTAVGRRLVTRSLRGARLRGVSVRDAGSAALLARLGVPDVVTAADLALGLPPPDEAPEDAVSVCLRPAVRSTALPDPLVVALAQALDQLAADGLAVRFVAFQADRDDAVHRQVAARMRAPAELCTPGLDEILREVARGRAVVAMRYHAGVAAVLAGRPAVLIDYSPKVGSLAVELGPGGCRLGLDPADLASVPVAVGAVLGHPGAVAEARDRLRERERGNDLVLDRLLGGT